ncbi:choloylglycine hydrolase family [Vibrio ishigakensis]|uniref:Choloylglycine hydrolase family n=1 Tax=Vibrio ishigakensis TaxID=1481914 RepID=A0A0B8Q4Q0_9VIBR|nr:choloylglycine hydrolase family [Vibrio ishigakensis]
MKMKSIALALATFAATTSVGFACTSVAWNTDDFGTLTSRTMDWVESTKPVLGNINKGEVRSIQGNGMGDTYTVKYNMIATLAYGELVADGINEKGLQVNALFYPDMTMKDSVTGDEVTQFTFAEYVLASYASVQEAYDAIPKLNLARVKMAGMPMEMNLHWSITDKSGDRLVVQMDDDGLKMYRGEEAMVMTNDPSLAQQLESKAEVIDTWADATRDTDYGSIGNGNSTSRFLHAGYFLSKLEQPTSTRNGMMKLSTVPFRVAADAPYKDFGTGRGVDGYATEWTMTSSLDTGDVVFEYNFDDSWNTVQYNVYDLMGKEFRKSLSTNDIAPLTLD